MSSLNFNIKNYTETDLKEIFGLPESYDNNVIDIQETKLREKLLSNTNLTPKIKEETVQFLQSAKIILQKKSKNRINTQTNNPYALSEYKEQSLILTKQAPSPPEVRQFIKYLNVDTRFRENYFDETSNFDVDLSLKLNNVTKMQLASIEFPATFYMVTEEFENDHFTLKITTGGGKDDQQIDLPDQTFIAVFQLKEGNYTSNSLLEALNTTSNYVIIQSGSEPTYTNNGSLSLRDMTDIGIPSNTNGTPYEYKGLTNNNIYTIFHYIYFNVDITDTTGSGTGKSQVRILEHNPFDFSNDNFQIKKVELIFNESKEQGPSNTPLPRKLGWILGFRKAHYEVITPDRGIADVDGNTVNEFGIIQTESENHFYLESESLLSVTGPKYIYFAVDDNNNNPTENNSFQNAFDSAILNKHILARIPLTTFSFSFEIANNLNIVSTPREYSPPIIVDKLRIQILDEYGRVLNLNKMNLSFCLSFTIKYEG